MQAIVVCYLALLLALPVTCDVDEEALKVLRRSGSLFWINRQRLNKFKPHRASYVEFGPMHAEAKDKYGREFQRKLEELNNFNKMQGNMD